MILVLSNQHVTRTEEITDYGIRSTKVIDLDGTEHIDQIFWFTIDGRKEEVTMSEWNWIYVLMPDLINQRPLSNANWIKRP